jgi:putative hemolysin
MATCRDSFESCLTASVGCRLLATFPEWHRTACGYVHRRARHGIHTHRLVLICYKAIEIVPSADAVPSSLATVSLHPAKLFCGGERAVRSPTKLDRSIK